MIPSVMETEQVVAGKPIVTLSAHDRCDGCGARAYVKVSLDYNGGDLLFCGHHWKKNEKALRLVSDNILDETFALLER